MKATLCACVLAASSLLVLVRVVASTQLLQAGFKTDDVRARIDQLFAQWDRRDSPGCALGVIKDGKMVYQRGYGMADLEHDVPIGPDSVFYIASLSKQFTAFAVALLAQEGKLSLDDDVRKYLPRLPHYDSPVTIRHLIHHTGGLREFDVLLTLAGRRQGSAEDNNEIVEMMARQKEPIFPAGAEFLYSNTGYALLAPIVERASGMSFSAYSDARIFKPLGMRDTHFHDDLSKLVSRRVYAYAPHPGGGFMLATPSVTLVGVAGVFTTVRDLAKWDQNFYDAAVGGRELIAQIQKPGTLHQGQPLEYAFGLYVRTLGRLRIQEHGGDLGGYRSWMKRVPEQRFSVICLCNLTTILQGNIASYVTNIYLATGGPTSGPVAVQPGNIQRQQPPAALGPSSRLRLEDLSEYTGEYYSEELDASYIVTAEEGRLFYQVRRMPRTQLAADQQKDVFRTGTLALTFSRNPARQIVGFTLDADRTRNLRFMKRHP